MTLLKISSAFLEFVQQLKDNEKLEVLTVAYPATAEKADTASLHRHQLPPGIISYFEELNGMRLSWQNRLQKTNLIQGSLVLLPAAEATKHWNDAIYFDDATSAAKKQFYPIDQFSDEACCGIFGGKNDHLHYYAFSSGHEPYDLQLNIGQYISMAIAAKCYYYWPLILKLILEKTESPMIQKMNDDMAVLFPEFSMEKWVQEYKKIKKKAGPHLTSPNGGGIEP